MDWILILILALDGGRLATIEIAGHKTKQACLATLDNAKREAENHFGIAPEASREMFRRSFCVERGR